jgi:hypothetical protein
MPRSPITKAFFIYSRIICYAINETEDSLCIDLVTVSGSIGCVLFSPHLYLRSDVFLSLLLQVCPSQHIDFIITSTPIIACCSSSLLFFPLFPLATFFLHLSYCFYLKICSLSFTLYVLSLLDISCFLNPPPQQKLPELSQNMINF